jgi:rRNA small subunit pseudouridine methyltransferase Nep1
MLNLIIAEASLETVPEEIQKDPQIERYAEKLGKNPNYLILDKSYHFKAMEKLHQKDKRGRPDIIHITLLETLGSIANREGLLQTYIHTINNFVITVNSETRLPRNYNRFIGLMEQLFREKTIPPKKPPLLKIQRQSLRQLVTALKPPYVIAFTTLGNPMPVTKIAEKLAGYEKPLAIIGGFPHGHFAKSTLKIVNECVCIDPEGLDTWTVTSRLLSSYEETLGLPEKRLRKIGQQISK